MNSGNIKYETPMMRWKKLIKNTNWQILIIAILLVFQMYHTGLQVKKVDDWDT